jgi:hypothetical protein
MAAGRIRLIEKSNDLVRNQTHYLPAYKHSAPTINTTVYPDYCYHYYYYCCDGGGSSGSSSSSSSSSTIEITVVITITVMIIMSVVEVVPDTGLPNSIRVHGPNDNFP